jgi:hypothetical protein
MLLADPEDGDIFFQKFNHLSVVYTVELTASVV